MAALALSYALSYIFQFLAVSWWLWAFLLLFPIFESSWVAWRQEKFKKAMRDDSILLELKVPREVRKSPRAMEQVLQGLHAIRNSPGTLKEKWMDGEVTKWFSLEMVSLGGEVHLYIRIPSKKLKGIVESIFFSYYPDLEIDEVDDYMSRFPASAEEMVQQGYDIWGTEMLLAKEDAYPIKSYLEFESPVEEKEYDPISSFLEILGKLKKDEIVGIQIEIAPADRRWRDAWKDLVESLRGKEKKSDDPAKAMSKMISRTPGETEVLKRVEENLSFDAFHTLIRIIYLAPKELFSDTLAKRGIMGSFNQYSALDGNAFVSNKGVSFGGASLWSWPHLFPKKRTLFKKHRLLLSYRRREVPPETFMGNVFTSHTLNWNKGSRRFLLTTRSLATLFHPPIFLVLTAPHIHRIESKKGGPPAGLPIYGDEQALEKYL